MERLKKHDTQHEDERLKVIRLLPEDRIILDVRKRKLVVGRVTGISHAHSFLYDLVSTDSALEMYQQLMDASKSGKLKNVKII